jgi:ATP-binding cassette subfamily F protein 1
MINAKNITISVAGKKLFENIDLDIVARGKYGIVGKNGIGKSVLLKNIYEHNFGIPKSTEIFYVDQDIDFDHDKPIYQIILESNRKKKKLLEKYRILKNIIEDETIEITDETYDSYEKINQKIHNFNLDKDEHIVRKILYGLGFDLEKQNWNIDKFSGGWKMKISLARGLYIKPDILLLDEPSNHLDLDSVIWLIDYLRNSWKKTLLLVSHDKTLLNDVCTCIIHAENKKITYYDGNYDQFWQMYLKNLRHHEKEWKKVLRKINEMRKKNLNKDQINKFIELNSVYKPQKIYNPSIYFEEIKLIKSPVIKLSDISFSYEKPLFSKLDVTIDLDTRMTIVGKNGVGKSTLLKIIVGEIKPLSGDVYIDCRATIGYYNQNIKEYLPLNETPLSYLNKINPNMENEIIRKHLGSVGLEGPLHLVSINYLSGGQKARVVLASIIIKKPHILLLDEPTNHLDLETVRSLIEAINSYNGGVIIISHNIDLITKTNCQIMELDNQTLKHIPNFDFYCDKVINNITN